MIVVDVLLGVLGAGALWLATGVRVVQQVERGVVFRFGRVRRAVRQPGVTMLIPVADRLRKVNVQIITMPVPAQEGITRDNVTVRVDAVVYFKVEDPILASVNVQNYTFAMSQVAQTSLRSIIGKSELDDLLTNREPLNQGLELMIDSPAAGWGIHIDRVEIKDVALPESMKRSMSRQAEAERERRARIITADGEFQASRKLSEAAAIMSNTPAALQLRLLQTVVEVAAEKNSTLVLPFPVELLRFLDGATPDSSKSPPLVSEAAKAAAAAAAALVERDLTDQLHGKAPEVPEIPKTEMADLELESGGPLASGDPLEAVDEQPSTDN
ncbi:slipin family protein [Streptacidiphilus carbonis]|jgi:regulator of protease activity HflC (stomatin/prohibitin superfamily)|uniref:slipin family protein n=1 Tax=Streptacidiphilus carbonis TaxID=105422 RepID=UPI000A052080|nr:slipin family protein [Streptacidiphilus carbonis]